MLLVSFKRYVSVSVISHNITAQGAKNGKERERDDQIDSKSGE